MKISNYQTIFGFKIIISYSLSSRDKAKLIFTENLYNDPLVNYYQVIQ